VKAVLDTNILIDYLNGVDAARREIALYERPMISPITWMEVMVGANEGKEQPLRSFLDRFVQVPIDAAVAEAAVEFRRRHRIRLPDAIVWATARTCDALLITRNTKDFPPSNPSIRIPYSI
jgi:hypothetical protein